MVDGYRGRWFRSDSPELYCCWCINHHKPLVSHSKPLISCITKPLSSGDDFCSCCWPYCCCFLNLPHSDLQLEILVYRPQAPFHPTWQCETVSMADLLIDNCLAINCVVCFGITDLLDMNAANLLRAKLEANTIYRTFQPQPYLGLSGKEGALPTIT